MLTHRRGGDVEPFSDFIIPQSHVRCQFDHRLLSRGQPRPFRTVPDAIVCPLWCLETFHHHAIERMRHGAGQSYSIPYRCLVPKGLNNVLVAGRCIGADRGMQASARVIPCCYITGQAAGVAAAVCAEDGVCARDADVDKIIRCIKQL